jgi:hypothetical protein
MFLIRPLAAPGEIPGRALVQRVLAGVGHGVLERARGGSPRSMTQLIANARALPGLQARAHLEYKLPLLAVRGKCFPLLTLPHFSRARAGPRCGSVPVAGGPKQPVDLSFRTLGLPSA